jgi:hypothetical protein
MRRSLGLLTGLIALLLAPTAAAQVPAGIFASDNIEWLGNRAIHSDTAGGALHEGFFYITTERDLTIYDVMTDPENPTQVGRFTFPELGTPVFTEENPTTNGEILLVENGGVLMVIDVREKSAPKLLSSLDGVSEHTITCIYECTWAYGSEGAIIDLRVPESPKAAGDWSEVVGYSSSHDVTEVAPGYVLTSTEPPTLLDVRDPAKPVKLATGDSPGFVHANMWPHQMRDDWILVGGEGSGPDCTNNPESSFFTLDGRDWQKDKRFELVGEFKMNTGLFVDGASPESTFCVHWFDTHPSYVNGGLAAISWYEHGARFLQVGTDGKIAEVGYFLPAGGQSSAIYWITDRIAYIADYTRGLDIVKFNGDIPQGRPHQTTPVSPGQQTPNPGTGSGPTTTPKQSTGVSFSDLVALPKRCGAAKKFSVRTKRAKDPVVAMTVFVNGKKAGTVRGSKLRKPVRVKKVPRKRAWSLQVEVTTKSGFKTAGQRKYRGCR